MFNTELKNSRNSTCQDIEKSRDYTIMQFKKSTDVIVNKLVNQSVKCGGSWTLIRLKVRGDIYPHVTKHLHKHASLGRPTPNQWLHWLSWCFSCVTVSVSLCRSLFVLVISAATQDWPAVICYHCYSRTVTQSCFKSFADCMFNQPDHAHSPVRPTAWQRESV